MCISGLFNYLGGCIGSFCFYPFFLRVSRGAREAERVKKCVLVYYSTIWVHVWKSFFLFFFFMCCKRAEMCISALSNYFGACMGNFFLKSSWRWEGKGQGVECVKQMCINELFNYLDGCMGIFFLKGEGAQERRNVVKTNVLVNCLTIWVGV